MLPLNLAAALAVAMLLSAPGTAKSDAQQPWPAGSGDQGGGATCTNCTDCPYSCRQQTQPPPPGAGMGLPGYPSPGSNFPPGTAPACCQQQNPNFNYYNSPPYYSYSGNELRKPFGFGGGLTGFLQLVFLAFLWGVKIVN